MTADGGRVEGAQGWRPSEVVLLAVLAISAAVWAGGVLGAKIYPTPNLPSFGNIPDQSFTEPTSWAVAFTNSNGEITTIPLEEIFPDATNSQWPNLFSGAVEHHAEADVQQWFAESVEAAGGTCASLITLTQRGQEPGTWNFDGSCP